jgi:regulator of sigma E protease
MTALLSVILAFMNILPIPALDGVYILFILIEMITRRKPSDKFIGYANTVGFAILILLLLYANGMDFVRLFK